MICHSVNPDKGLPEDVTQIGCRQRESETGRRSGYIGMLYMYSCINVSVCTYIYIRFREVSVAMVYF